MTIIKLLRPHQYVKNSFVLIGVFFSMQWDSDIVIRSFLAFLAFCAVSSSVYIFNDILDIESDKQHPTKKNRPLASGAVSIKVGIFTSLLLVTTSLILALYVSMWCLIFIAAYAVMNIGYSLHLKHIAVLDVFIISMGFMLRIFAGTVGLGIAPSSWLVITGLMITLFLGFAKRRAELLTIERLGITEQSLIRKVLDDYNNNMIEQFMSVTAACSVIAYSLYTVSPETIERHGTPNLIYTVPLVIYGVFRYVYLLHREGKGNDTAIDLYSDRHMAVAVLAWFGLTMIIIA